MSSSPLRYSDLVKDSLLGGGGMENGLQSTAIYWEAWSTSFSGLFGGLYGSKWSWKVLDDEIRQRFGIDGADTKKHDAFVFAPGDRQYVRKYAGDADIYDIVPTKKRYNFSFFPTGTKC
ncbi:conserved hypothetical protein [Perkinsus marinus ATCC 50983]|uniref:Uncharacterized protein n=1 Tax=Perkinsus marinus (strain ATCC 50983 / TXsc) TaxID=423536 RepID=C5LI59_PERM5|nr:conserved hypothetical protein [Perkinsus marinus ATCC 50983]EER03594.1 conserved hypothetical protein [Perkinsus marinus ATCC 50983]|mmetsp:Transcript_18632/g.18458  ORF Transcript_18632/g.18458 Transcript_18632/m.18458 type:complete len:119 (-) Transcript_18632:58-414(-)|eukprot:XP_002771778.1 conserved hypothetical protein [Perkinsus marinus ATCC 50983]